MRRIRGIKSLIHNAVDQTVDLVELGHESTARSVMRVFSFTGPLATPARQVNEARRLVTSGVLGTIKGVNHLVAVVSDAGLDVLALTSPEDVPMPLRADAMGSGAWVADAALGAVNGVLGDHLASAVNGLDLGMVLRGKETWIEEDGRGAPGGTKVVVLIHGLATTEWSWCMDADRYLGDPSANFGTLLEKDLGYTPVYVRYNTGRHISENGRTLAEKLEKLVAHWPVPVEDLVLLGHSMGGLVLRSACHIAHQEGQAWIQRVHRIVTLGSPMKGAPLEKFGNVASALLAAVDLPATAISARLINGRSAGIKDLRHGYVRDEDWQGADPDAIGPQRRREVEVPPHIAWCFVAATVGPTRDHPLSQMFGDLLVRVESASGPEDHPQVNVHHVGGVNHVAIQVHPQAYAIIREFLGEREAG